MMDFAVRTPTVLLLSVWPLPLSLATTRGISFDFSSSPYLDVSVRGVPFIYLCIQYMIHGSSPCEFPHSEICGSKLICSSPQLFAAYRVLHRLLMPRHSPYALFRLNYLSNIAVLSFLWIAWVSRTFSFRFVNSLWKGFILLCFESFSTFRWNCTFTQIGKTYNSYLLIS